MGLLQKFRVDTAGAWKADDGLRLDFDFDANALSGVRLRDPLTLLWKFGPPENPEAARQGVYRWFAKGFAVGARDGRIDEFLLIWDAQANPPFQPFSGSCRWRGEPIHLRAGLGEAELRARLGEPFWRNEDAEETLLFYQNKAVEWQVEISKAGGLSALTITALPLLADRGKS